MKLKSFMALYTILLLSTQCLSQKLMLEGIVVTNEKVPISHASISLEKGRNTTQTDSSGFFSLKYNGGPDLLLITSIGYRSLQVSVDSETPQPLFLTLQKLEAVLDEVIINTGYEQLPKERATGAFEKIDNELFNRNVSFDVISRLEGLSPSILLDKRNGDLQRFTVRGRSTIFGNSQPLIILDNFPYEGDISNINPNDVESISILKDAAAASIWGVRSGNGVIVITTKSGNSNKPVNITLNNNITIGQKPDIYYLPAMLSSDFIDVEKDLFYQGFYTSDENNTSWPVLSPVVEILIKQRDGLITESEADAEIQRLRSIDVRNDIEKYLFENSVSHQHSLSISGGAKDVSYYVSGGLDRSRSIYGAIHDRRTVRNKLSIVPAKNLTVNLALNLAYTESKTGRPAYNSITSGRKQLYPYAEFADKDGNPLAIVHGYRMGFLDTVGGGLLLDWKYRPLEQLTGFQGTTLTSDNILDVQTIYSLLPGLEANLQYQYQGTKNDFQNLNSMSFYSTRDQINRYSQIINGEVVRPVPLGKILRVSHSNTSTQSVRGSLRYSKKLRLFELNLVGGAEYRNHRTVSNQFTEYGFNDELLTFVPVDHTTEFPLFFGSKARIPTGKSHSDIIYRFTSAFANASLNVSNKYFFSGSARKDASNVFGVDANQKGVPLWSTGMAWNIHKEKFYRYGGLNYLRLAATYGFNGNLDNTLSAYPILHYLGISGVTNTQYGVLLNPPNEKLRWERIRTINLSLDFRSTSNILNGTLSFYSKKGLDLIGNASIDPTTGLLSFKGNVADMITTGVEGHFALRITNREVKWTTNLLFTKAANKVTKYEEMVELANGYIGTESIIVPLAGNPLYGVYSYKWGGLDPNTGNARGVLNGKLTEDYSAIIEGTPLKELIFHGSGIPTLFGNVRNDITWKNLSLSIGLSYRLGYYYRRSSINYEALYNRWAGHKDFASRWQKPGDEAFTNVPSAPPITSLNMQRDMFYSQSEILVDKADNIRLHDVNLTYSIGPLKRGTFFRSMQFYLYAKDLGIIWRANKHRIDPDYQQILPFKKSISAGIRTNL